MKLEFWMIGKTAFSYLEEGMAIYEKRLKRYIPVETRILPDIKNAKNLSPIELKRKEGELILSKINSDDCLILLDERGKVYDSVGFARFLEQQLQSSRKRLVFQIGGAYGFSEAVYQRANYKIALSKMTFSHQMVRLFFLEQLYRGMTILRGEPYHNQG
jgi:23S rRNA (pseudouridine1915-N3)-methyltransferase